MLDCWKNLGTILIVGSVLYATLIENTLTYVYYKFKKTLVQTIVQAIACSALFLRLSHISEVWEVGQHRSTMTRGG